MQVTRKRHREPVSYHLLCDALTLRDTGESALLVHAIQRVVSGLVTHDHYANAAQSAAGALSLTKVRQQLAIAIAVDANPIAALFPPTVRAEDFESRWNALNQAAHFGVKTCLENFGTDAEEVSRISATGERDELFRAEMMSHFLELLSGGHRANIVDTLHNRAYYGVNLGDTAIDITMETRGREQVEELLAALTAAGYRHSRVL